MSQPTHRRAYTDDSPAPPARWTPFRIGWAVIFVVTIALRVFMLSSWSWLADDLLFTSLVPSMGFGEYVFQDIAGHVFPGDMVLAWVITTLDPLDYMWAALTTVVLSGALVIAWGLALREIFGERVHLLIALVVLSLSPTMTVVSLWWVSSINTLPIVTAMGFSVWFLARYLLRQQHRGDLIGLSLSYALGLFFAEKSLLITIPLLFLCFLLAPTVRGAGRLAVRALWPVTVLTVAYLGFYAWAVRGGVESETRGEFVRTVPNAASAAAHGSADVLLPALAGGPFTTVETANSAFAATPSAVAYLMCAAAAVLVVAGVLLRRRGGLAVAMLVTYLAFTWGVWFFSDRYALFGVANLQTGRYTADALPVALLTCMYLVTSVVGETDPLRRPVTTRTRTWIRRGLVAYLVAVSVSAMVTTGRVWNELSPTSSKPYWDNLVDDATGVGPATVYDTAPPPELVNAAYLPAASSISAVLAPLDLPLSFDEPTDQLLVATEDGHLRNAEVVGGVGSLPGPDGDCVYAVAPGETTDIPLDGGLFDYRWGAALTYFTGADARIRLRTDQDAVELDLTVNPPNELATRQLLLTGPVTSLSVEVLSGDLTVCVTDVRVGNLEAGDEVPDALKDG